jgi:glycosyltransferase involved in cell wall biosynthesis
MHFFNGICVSKVPWITSIELEYPRYFGNVPKKAFAEALDRIMSSDCKMLMPLSEAARRHFLSRLEPSIRECVAAKTTVFTGGVSIPRTALEIRERRAQLAAGEFVVGFVGNDFWRKGGPAVLAAVEALRGEGADVRLLVVSSVEGASYISPRDHAEVRRTRNSLATTPWIDWHEHIPNAEVLNKVADCDVFAFPTLDESLGWVAIEAAGLGIPVISSNVFALPELVVDGVTGVTIELPLDKDGRWIGIEGLNPSPRPSYDDASSQLTQGLISAIRRMIDSPALCAELGRAGRERFLQRYEEQHAASTLANLLRRALG